MIKGVFIIIAYLVAGNVFSSLTGHFIPGSVCGMLLLFGSLMTGLVKPESIRKVAEFLTSNMTVLFIPASIGIMEQWGLIRNSFAGWLVVIFLSTILVLASVGLIEDWLVKAGSRIKKRRDK